MLKGTFYLINEPDLLELFFQKYAENLAIKGGPAAMQEQADKELQQATLFLVDYPGGAKPHTIMVDLLFAGQDDNAVIEARLVETDADELANYLIDTEILLDETRQRESAS